MTVKALSQGVKVAAGPMTGYGDRPAFERSNQRAMSLSPAAAHASPSSQALDACWNDHDRRVIRAAEALANADAALLDALMASNASHRTAPDAGRLPPDPAWLDYLERRRNVADNVVDALETVLARLPIPRAEPARLTSSQARRLAENNILDTMNLMGAVEVFRARARRCDATPVSDGKNGPGWHGFDRGDAVKRFGKPHNGFRNHDGLFGMWWFQVPDHPWIAPSRLFNVCAGPTGLRAGLLIRDDHADDLVLWENHFALWRPHRSAAESISLDSLLITWFHSSVAAALCPALPNPWPRLQPWHFDETAPTSPR